MWGNENLHTYFTEWRARPNLSAKWANDMPEGVDCLTYRCQDGLSTNSPIYRDLRPQAGGKSTQFAHLIAIATVTYSILRQYEANKDDELINHTS